MTLENYHTLFVIFFVITILLLILSGVLFVLFDIRRIISVKTGRALKKNMKKLKGVHQGKNRKNIPKWIAALAEKKTEKLVQEATMILEQRVPTGDMTTTILEPQIYESRSEDEFFNIVETRLVLFSDEVIKIQTGELNAL